MSVFPHTRLFCGASKTVDIAGAHIQVLDTKTGALLHSTAQLPDAEQAPLLKSGPIRCAAVDREMRYLLTSGEDKILKLWELEGLKLVNERELPKKPTALAFTADAQTLLVSDKFGDVFSYPFTYVPLAKDSAEAQEREKQNAKDALASHENPSNGQLILGHVSPLNAFLLSPDEKYILTADRDEHIRVSWYPKGYNIEMYCLGHLKFVSAIHIPPSDTATLISGGGDPVLKLWDWMSGVLKHELPVLDTVEPFIAVKASRTKRWFEADPSEGGEKAGGRAKRGKRGKGKGKQQDGGGGGAAASEEKETEGATVVVREEDAAEAEQDDNATPTPAPADVTMEDTAVESAEVQKDQNEGEKVLVIRRIESVEADDGTYIVFSAVGATAVFAFKYAPGVSPSDIRHFDFGKPVLDFAVLDNKTIVANVDGQWTSPTSSETEDKSMAKALKISNGQLVEDSESLTALLTSLNSPSVLLPATPQLLQKQNLYGDLISLPKHVDTTDGGEDGGLDGEPLPIGAPVLSSSEVAKARGKGKVKGKAELSKKELGRIKTKQAVAAKALENQNQAKRTASEEVGAEAGEGEGEGEPEKKRARSEVSAGKQQDGERMDTEES